MSRSGRRHRSSSSCSERDRRHGARRSTVDVEETPDDVRLNLAGDGADVLLRRKGEALDALQLIVNTAFRRDARGERHYVVDALGFRKDKDAELRQMARFLVGEGEDDRRAAGDRAAQSRTSAASCTWRSPRTRRRRPRASATRS